VVPQQLFIPPTWLTGGTLGLISLHVFYRDLVEELNTFRSDSQRTRAAVRVQGWLALERVGQDSQNCGAPYPRGAGSWTYIEDGAALYLDRYINSRRQDRAERAEALLASRDDYRIITENNIRDTVVYVAQLRELGISDSESEDEKRK